MECFLVYVSQSKVVEWWPRYYDPNMFLENDSCTYGTGLFFLRFYKSDGITHMAIQLLLVTHGLGEETQIGCPVRIDLKQTNRDAQLHGTSRLLQTRM
jgi:hypothetical protein